MSRHPNRPTSHDCRLQIGLDLILIILKRLPLDKIQVTKEHEAEDGIPNSLINENFGSDSLGLCSREFRIEESVEVMPGSTVDEETEGSETDGTHGIVGLAILVDKVLGEDITDGKTS